MKSLAGKRILVTRPRAQAGGAVEKLLALGAIPLIFPAIEISPLEDTTQLDLAITRLGTYQWVIFTSVNGVAAFWQRLEALGKGRADLQGIYVAAIGPATAQALRDRQISPDFVPEEYVAEAILPGLGDVRGQHILLPRADIARKALVEALASQGALPEEVAVYRTLPGEPDAQVLKELEQGVDVVLFTSSSTVRNTMALLGAGAQELLRGALIACIGPITAATARECGLAVDVVAADYTRDGLIAALLAAGESTD
jgi:uroporphyrinogen-III synthase